MALFHSKLTLDSVVAGVLPAPSSHRSVDGKPTRMVVKKEKSVPQAVSEIDSRRSCRVKVSILVLTVFVYFVF